MDKQYEETDEIIRKMMSKSLIILLLIIEESKEKDLAGLSMMTHSKMFTCQ